MALLFTIPDFIVLGAMLTISLAIGVYFALRRGGQRSPHDYLLAGGNLSFWPVCLSHFATFQSAVGFLGITSDVYVYGSMIGYHGIGIVIANIITAVFIVPLFHPLKLTSVYQYLQMRYDSKVVRYIGVVTGMMVTTLYMTFVLLSPALAIEAVTDLPVSWTMVMVACVGTLYTTIGGMKSVIWTDVFQTIIMLVGLIAIIIKGTLEVGGIHRVFQLSKEGERLVFDEISPDLTVRQTVWGWLIGYMWFSVSINLRQSSIQRISTTKNVKHAKLVFFAALPLNFAYASMLTCAGLIAYAYFVHKGCDPLENGDIENSNQIIIYFVVRVLGFIPGISGLYLSTILSGSLSTLSSGLNALAANTVEDVLRKPLSKMSSLRVTTITKVIVFFYGCVFTGLAYLMRALQGPVTEVSTMILGACGGPLFAMFVLGAVFPQANKVGAVVGFVTSLAMGLWMNAGALLMGTPTPHKPPGPVYACANVNVTSPEVFSPLNEIVYDGGDDLSLARWRNDTQVEASAVDKSGGGFYLYDVSYVWFSLITCTIGVLVGLVTSYIALCINPDGYPKAPPHLVLPVVRRFLNQEPYKQPPQKRVLFQMERTYTNDVTALADDEKAPMTDPIFIN